MRRTALFVLFATLGACDGIVGLGAERTRADAAAEAAAGDDAGDAGKEIESDRCTEHGKGVRWALQFGDGSLETAGGIAVGGGSIYFPGFFNGSELDFGGGPLTHWSKADLFLAKFDTNGKHLWSQSFGDNDDQGDTVAKVRPMPDGGVLLFGDYKGSIDFGGGFAQAAEGKDGFIARYDASGNRLWSKTVTTAGHDVVNDAAVDAQAGTIVVAVQFGGPTFDFNSDLLPHVDYIDFMLAKLDFDGNQLWRKVFGAPGGEMVHSLAIDATGRIAIAGQYDSTLEFGTVTLTAIDEPDAFLALLQPNSDTIWAQSHGGPGFQIGHRIAWDEKRKNIVVAGYLTGSMSIAGTTVSTKFGGYVATLNDAGEHQASIPVPEFFVPRGLAVDPEGNTVIGGPFDNVTDFGANPIATEGFQDGIVAKLGVGLEHLWSYQVGTIGTDNVWGVAVDEASAVYVAAYFQGEIELDGCGKLTSAGDTDLLMLKFDP